MPEPSSSSSAQLAATNSDSSCMHAHRHWLHHVMTMPAHSRACQHPVAPVCQGDYGQVARAACSLRERMLLGAHHQSAFRVPPHPTAASHLAWQTQQSSAGQHRLLAQVPVALLLASLTDSATCAPASAPTCSRLLGRVPVALRLAKQVQCAPASARTCSRFSDESQ